MATVKYTLSSKVDARGKSEVLLRLVAGRGFVFRARSGIWVSPDRWRDGGVVIPRMATPEQAELREVKARLEALEVFLLDGIASADKADVTGAWARDAVDRFHHPERGGAGLDFFALLERFRDSRDVSPSRRRRYETTIGALRRFEAWRGRPLTVKGTDADTLESFRRFLFREHEICRRDEWRDLYWDVRPEPGPRGKNSVVGYLTVVRAFFHWLAETGVHDNDPFRRFRVGSAVYGTPYYLTIGERDAIARADLSDSPRLAAQRDIFVFQCLTGCRVGDLVRFRKSDVSGGFLTYIPRKTREGRPVVVRVPLTATAIEIVERYAGFRGDALLPFVSPQRYDKDIKAIFTRAGITRAVTILDPLTRQEVKRPLNEVASSHLARRTFVGNLYRQVKDPALIGSMTGHVEGSRAFARYRDIDDDLKAEVVGLLEG